MIRWLSVNLLLSSVIFLILRAGCFAQQHDPDAEVCSKRGYLNWHGEFKLQVASPLEDFTQPVG
jgi:hypothetical protein